MSATNEQSIGWNVTEVFTLSGDEKSNIIKNTMIKMIDESVQVAIRVPISQASGKIGRNIGEKVLNMEDPNALNTCENITSTVTYFALTYGIPRIGFGGLDIGKWIFNPANSIRDAMATGDTALVGGGNSLLDDIMENS